MAIQSPPEIVGTFFVMESTARPMTRDELRDLIEEDELLSAHLLTQLAERKNAYVIRHPQAMTLSPEQLTINEWDPIDSDDIEYSYEAGVNPPGIDDGPREFGDIRDLVDYLIDLPDADLPD